MKTTSLVQNEKKYAGKYVATRSFVDRRVVVSGNKPASVFARARKKGVADPVIIYVPKSDMTHVFSCR